MTLKALSFGLTHARETERRGDLLSRILTTPTRGDSSVRPFNHRHRDREESRSIRVFEGLPKRPRIELG